MQPSILVVEDERLIRWSLVKYLKRIGYRAIEAQDGETAAAKLTEDVDLVLLDQRLPDTDGIALLRMIRQKWPNCRSILMTAFGRRETADAARALGAFEVLTKPFEFERLGPLVRAALAAEPKAGGEDDSSGTRQTDAAGVPSGHRGD